MIPKLSLILCIKNAMVFLPKLLEQIDKQKNVSPCEFLIADTNSKDGSWDFLKSLKEKKFKSLRLFKIKPKDFGHGKTRNKLIKKAKGKIIVFISQDIKITSNLWLYRLIKPLEKSDVGAAFSRQIPYPDANLYDKFFYRRAYPNKNRIISRVDEIKFGVDTIFFSMVSAAAKKNLLIKHPFVNGKDASIDQWLAKAVIENGYKIQYVANAAVYHSHNYSLKELFKRNFYSGQSQIGFPRRPFLKSIISILDYLAKEFNYIRELRGFGEIGGMVVYELVRFAGFWLGSKSRLF